MQRFCKICNIELNENTWVKVSKNGIRSRCKKCRVKQVVEYDVQNSEKRKIRVNAWTRRIGRVKQYPCITCQNLCYKKYAYAFCSDMCRFMFYVEKTDSCWMWKGPLNRQGYGKICFKNNKTAIAHRVSYELHFGEIPDNKLICHACDNRKCVNPSHLWMGTQMENMIDMIDKGRQSSKLTALDVLKIRNLIEKFGVSHKKICEQYGISAGTVSSIISRNTWKHV